MLFVLIVLLLVASVFVLLMKKNRESLLLIAAGFTMLTKRNRESLFLMGMCCSLMV